MFYQGIPTGFTIWRLSPSTFFFFYLVILFCEEWFLYKDKAYSILRVSLKCNESHQQSLIVCKHGDTKGALISTLLTNTPSPPYLTYITSWDL